MFQYFRKITYLVPQKKAITKFLILLFRGSRHDMLWCNIGNKKQNYAEIFSGMFSTNEYECGENGGWLVRPGLT